MSWKDLVDRLDDGGDETRVQKRRYKCQVCEEETLGMGPTANHVRGNHPDELAALEQEHDRTDPDPGQPDPHEDPDSSAGGLEDLAQRDPSQDVQIDQKKPSAWDGPGLDLEDRPNPRRSPPDPDEKTPARDPPTRPEPAVEIQPEQIRPAVRTTWQTVGKVAFERRGLDGFTDDDLDALTDAWTPVAMKWLPDYGEEAGALLVTAMIVVPKILEAREHAQDDPDPDEQPGPLPDDTPNRDQEEAAEAAFLDQLEA